MSRKPTKQELAAERAKYEGLTSPEADRLGLLRRYVRPTPYKSVAKMVPRFIAEGYWDAEKDDLTPRGLAVVKTLYSEVVEVVLGKARDGEEAT